MEVANHDWTNRFNSMSVCTFPDCRNESRCLCSKCLTLYCNLHLQIHLANCNNMGELSGNNKSIEHHQIINEVLCDPRSTCLI